MGPTALENEFTRLIESYDIICFTETWHAGKNDLENKINSSHQRGTISFRKVE